MSPREIPSCQIQRANFDRKKEEPYATILGCSDSRAPPESIFDANFGELFILGRWQCHFGRRHGQHAIRWSALEYNALCGFWGTRGGAVRPALHTFGDNVLPGLPEFAPSVSGQDQLALAVQAAVRWSMHQLWRRRKGTELCKKAAPNWLVPSFRSILVRSGFYLDFTMQEEQYLITEGDASLNRGGRGFAKSCDCAKV